MRIKHFFLCCITLIILAGCEKEASSLDYGTPLIYMPQSTQSSSNIVYNVPSGFDSATYNYVIDSPDNKLNIVLGVLRTGKVANNAFSVAILTNPDTVTAAIAGGSLVGNPDPTDSIVLLPSAAYSLPATVSVPSGSNQATFYLSVDLTQLKALGGKKAALAVYLDKPSTYQLSTTNAETIVLIDVNALHL
ncbi:MAG TPA: DUF1735 domain-containing protein [Puia sp.]|nr:DUF1735 domain-containing protein [Puia sp.]